MNALRRAAYLGLAAFLAVVAIAGVHSPALAADEAIDAKPAMAAAEAWLAMLDAGRYDETWEGAAPLFKGAITKEKWQAAIDAARAPLGVVIVRKLRSAIFARTLPNAPPGEYFEIQYDTRFDNRPLTIEIVTPMRDADGAWRVSGYIIR
jgi:hypothetical protein